MHSRLLPIVCLTIIGIVGIACTPAAATLDADATKMAQAVAQTLTAAVPTQTSTHTPLPPTATPLPPTATAIRTPPALPEIFHTNLLNPADQPRTYIKDVCQYLRQRWNPNNSAPGTVVMPIMLHSITDSEVTQPDQISRSDFDQLMNDLHSQGFETITSAKLADFLERNAKIPPRSVILIVDDRKREAYFRTHFQEYYEKWGWTVTNSWISAPDTPEYLWKENETMAATGWVDYQAHGVIHNTPIEGSVSEQYIRGELQGSIDAITQHFGKRPIAFIWPGGGFTPKAVQIARELGYRIGFTINPRGPLMFNWIPLGDAKDPNRPYFIPEASANDPLLVLPRYWDTDASRHIDLVRQIGKAAAAQAAIDRAVELEYYDIVCKPSLGEIPAATP